MEKRIYRYFYQFVENRRFRTIDKLINYDNLFKVKRYVFILLLVFTVILAANLIYLKNASIEDGLVHFLLIRNTGFSLIFSITFACHVGVSLFIYKSKSKKIKIEKIEKEILLAETLIGLTFFAFFLPVIADTKFFDEDVFAGYLIAYLFILYVLYSYGVFSLLKKPELLFNLRFTSLISSAYYLIIIGLALFIIGKWIGLYRFFNFLILLLSISIGAIGYFMDRTGKSVNNVQLKGLSIFSEKKLKRLILTACPDKKYLKKIKRKKLSKTEFVNFFNKDNEKYSLRFLQDFLMILGLVEVLRILIFLFTTKYSFENFREFIYLYYGV